MTLDSLLQGSHLLALPPLRSKCAHDLSKAAGHCPS